MNDPNFYDRLKKELDESNTLPGNYKFKFIVPTDVDKIDAIKNVFDRSTAKFSMKESSNGKYTSVTVDLYCIDSEQVIKCYQSAENIEGIISL